ncbi:MAG: Crp/Fnr family transcriptional regulator [Saprospiraceae bacterium]|nr:Crp/Fnr family transcriptional regulator [Saprospiraceae bacterium]
MDTDKCEVNCCKTCPNFQQSIFCNSATKSLENIESSKDVKEFKKGSLIFREGTISKGLFCIKTGKIKITQIGNDGKEQIIHLLKSGDILGHRAIFGDNIYAASAYAIEDTKVCYFSKDKFISNAEEDGKLVLKIANILANELKESDKKFTDSAQQSVQTRVVECLLQLQKIYGFETDGKTINISLTREELAAIVGSTRETVTRNLYKLSEDGLIALHKKKIKILDEKKLKKMTF